VGPEKIAHPPARVQYAHEVTPRPLLLMTQAFAGELNPGGKKQGKGHRILSDEEEAVAVAPEQDKQVGGPERPGPCHCGRKPTRGSGSTHTSDAFPPRLLMSQGVRGRVKPTWQEAGRGRPPAGH
jgi:hypothetical protein